MNKVVFLIITALSLPALAVNKCTDANRTFYSDRACPSDAKGTSLKVPSTSTPPRLVKDADLSRRVATLCRADAAKWLPFKDPESLQFEEDGSYLGQEVTMRQKDGAGGPAIRMFVRINAKNSYGGYVGYESYVCYTDPQGQKIVGYSKFLQE